MEAEQLVEQEKITPPVFEAPVAAAPINATAGATPAAAQ
jgi:hypothetical protein